MTTFDIYRNGRLIASNLTLEQTAEWLAIDECDLAWAIDEHEQCDTDTLTAVRHGRHGRPA